MIGHCRALAAKKLGLDTVPCVMVKDLTPEQIKALRIVDNKTNESDWDIDLLAAELPEIDLSAFDFDFGIEEENKIIEDEPPAVDRKEKPFSKEGDIFICGNHRVMCGDSTAEADVERLVNGAKIDMLLTDPPYGVAYEGKAGKMENDDLEGDEYEALLRLAFGNAKSVLKAGGAFHIWHADTNGFIVRKACNDAGLRVRQVLIWVKNAPVLGRQDFLWQHEPCLYGEKELPYGEKEEDGDEYAPCLYGWVDGTHYWYKNRKQKTVLFFDKPKKNADHPTMKPVELFDYEMQCNSKKGETVLDLFGGSGTTLSAAEQNGRVAYVMEKDPRYCDVIIKRWEALTGEKAIIEEQ